MCTGKRQTHIRNAPSSRTAVTGIGPYEASWSSGRYFNLVYRLFPHRARGNIPEQGLYRGLVAKKRAAWYNVCYKFGTDERKRS